MLKNPCKIENLKCYIDNIVDFFSKFDIYDDSILIQSPFCQIKITVDFISEI